MQTVADVRCTLCEKVLEEGAIPMLEHTPGEQTVTKAPTCTEEGEWVIRCTDPDCNDLIIGTGTIAALGHVYEGVITAPTCTEDGFTTFTCTRCEDTYVDDEVDALGHKPGRRIVLVEPTRTTKGEWEIRCRRCDEVLETGEIPMLKVSNAVTSTRDFVSIRETSRNVWELTFFATVTLVDLRDEVVGTERVRYSILINANNANVDGRFNRFDVNHDLVGFTLNYDIKGNGSNIRTLSLTR